MHFLVSYKWCERTTFLSSPSRTNIKFGILLITMFLGMFLCVCLLFVLNSNNANAVQISATTPSSLTQTTVTKMVNSRRRVLLPLLNSTANEKRPKRQVKQQLFTLQEL